MQPRGITLRLMTVSVSSASMTKLRSSVNAPLWRTVTLPLPTSSTFSSPYYLFSTDVLPSTNTTT